MVYASRIVPAGVLPALVALLVFAAGAVAGTGGAQEDTGSRTLELTPVDGQEVSGTVTFTAVEGGVEVTLEVANLPESGAEYPAHIHRDATCTAGRAGQEGPVEHSLEPVVAGEDGAGAGTTMLEGVELAGLFAGETTRYVDVHAARGDEVPPGIACADLIPIRTPGGEETLHETGGISPLLPAGIVALIGIGALAVRALATRGPGR